MRFTATTLALGAAVATSSVPAAGQEPTCADCKGGVTALTLSYEGDVFGAAVEVFDDKDETLFFDIVDPGEQFSIAGSGKKGKLPKNLQVFVQDQLNTEIHTSCSRPIGPGVRSGDFEVVESTSVKGGAVCPVPDCQACRGGVTDLTLEYLGAVAALVEVFQKKGDVKVFEGIVAPGAEFSFFGAGKEDKLGSEIRIFVEGALDAAIHTSCSRPIGPGLVSGDFVVLDGFSRAGGEICPLEEFDDDDDGCPVDDDDDDDDDDGTIIQ